MRGLISSIKRMEIHDGDGVRTTVFFKGCTLKCIWCHNPESISPMEQTAFFSVKCASCGLCKGEKNKSTSLKCPTDALTHFGTEYEADKLYEILAKDKAYFDNSGGGVTFSGGECLMQADFAKELAEKLKEKGISVYIDTCGYVKKEAFEKIIPFTDKFLYDIKAIDSKVHKECTGKDNDLILSNLRFILEKGCDVEIRYPLVKGYNDGEAEKIGEFLKKCNFSGKVKVLQYHDFSGSRYEALGMENTMPKAFTSFEDVEKAVKTIKRFSIDCINGMTED